MTKIRSYIVCLAGTFTLLSIALCSCTSAGPSRKKMPEFTETTGFEAPMPFDGAAQKNNAGQYAFSSSPVDMMLDGHMQQFVSIPLPDAANDSLAVSMLTNLKPFAIPLLTSWAQQERHAVILDLSAHQGASLQRSNFVIKLPGGYTIPLVVTWDAASAYRLLTIKQLAQGVPSIEFTQTN